MTRSGLELERSHILAFRRGMGRLHHIGLGRRHAGLRVLVLVADLDMRVLTEDGELLRELMLDPNRDYQRQTGP